VSFVRSMKVLLVVKLFLVVEDLVVEGLVVVEDLAAEGGSLGISFLRVIDSSTLGTRGVALEAGLS
jgi:hypothetical protein